MADVDVVVVGGGVSGLTAARVLCGTGLRVRLLERAPRCGGLVRTDRVGDWVIDAGPDTLLAHKPAALQLVHELGLQDHLVAPLSCRTTYVVRKGTLRALPETSALGFPTDIRTLLAARAFSWRGKLRMAAEPLLPPRPATADESIGSFVRRRFGREAVTYVAEPVLAGIHRGDAAALSLRALFPVLAGAEMTHGSVCRAWRSAAPGSGASRSMSLRGGLGELVASLHRQLPEGVAVTGVNVREVCRRDSFVVRLDDGSGLTARAVVLATPAHVTSRLTGSLDAGLADLCGSIRHAPSVNVALGYRRDTIGHSLKGWGVVVPAHEGRFLRSASWVSSKWPGRAPADHVLIRAAVAAPPAESFPDEALAAGAHRDLQDLIGVSAEPVLARVCRTPRAMPQLEVGHLERMAAIEWRLEEVPGLFISAGGFRGVGLPDCIADATAVARRTAAFLQHDS